MLSISNLDAMLEQKLNAIESGAEVIMSDLELDRLIELDALPDNVVSMVNPNQLGFLDAYLVGHVSAPTIAAARKQLDLVGHAARCEVTFSEQDWDEPAQASSARGWYWPKGSTTRGETLCAGTYLEYGPHYRTAAEQAKEPGLISCVVFSRLTGNAFASRYVQTVDDARSWIANTARMAGHIA